MKRTCVLFGLLIALSAYSQVTTIPSVIEQGYRGPVTIVFNPNQGNQGMQGATVCYAHTGVTINGQSWQHTGSWRDGNAKYQMTQDGDGCWRLEMPDGMYRYYGVDTTELITQMSFVFNDGPGGNKEGKSEGNGDIFVTLQRSDLRDLVETRPEGVDLGITYNPEDQRKVTLCTFAGANLKPNDPSELVPAKAVFVLGEFNNWKEDTAYQMKRDSCYFWLTLDSLVPGKEYAYQYLVIRSDGAEVTVSDAFAAKQYQMGSTYRSYFQTSQPNYQWSDATLQFVRPDRNNLIIYELWTYDYTPERNFKGLMKRLDYLQQLGVNAIELMPISEFEGDYNWGYSPTHYFAVDRQYGTPTQFRQLVDSIHSRGMAVIVDMVFNHATGLNPQNKLYPYGSDLPYNPWFNVTPPHGDRFYEDWNHDFPETRRMFTRCLNYWLDEYKVDGFRMDLSHGFCGKALNAMSNIVHYYDNAIAPHNAIFILEHWGNNMATERPALISRGMLCWQNTNHAYSQLAMGYTSESGLDAASRDGYVSYCESHDEERNYYKAYRWGKDPLTTDKEARISRVPLTIAFNVLLDGPHMIWQYNELGFDYSINMNEKGQESSDYRCNIKPRPDQMGWFADSLRMAQYVRVAQVCQLRTRLRPELFVGNPVESHLGGSYVRSITWGEGQDAIHVVGNFSANQSLDATLPSGTWYDYFTGTVVSTSTLSLYPGELRILTASYIACPTIDVTPFTAFNTGNTEPPRGADLDEVLTESSQHSEVQRYLWNNQVVIIKQGKIYSVTGQQLR